MKDNTFMAGEGRGGIADLQEQPGDHGVQGDWHIVVSWSPCLSLYKPTSRLSPRPASVRVEGYESYSTLFSAPQRKTRPTRLEGATDQYEEH